ncbi:hypothetical protein MN2019_20060 [Mycolicibacterium neoaurum]|uniref:hypothetical protein n=1 Tax=Mycolicibacterium neoaurum TaxID=1795 RepID=UPI001BCE63D3|nr:hypothetical protein [Mycolicibacterium neoaurum]QVI26563.1 hypothetical protein MN2019_20060 [Mycolicibacterium neoaurum]
MTPAEINDARESIVGIVDRLGRIALAVSMSGVYFKNTEGQVNELAPQYFSELEALSDDQAIPPGFNQTAFAAIQHAVRRLGKGTEAGDSARAVVEIGALLAPELLPLNLTLLATERSVSVNLAELPRPAEFDQVKRRAVLTALRTQTIARRVVNDGDGSRTPVSETVAIHPLVHEILQRSYLDEVPPGHLESQCAVFMYFLVGWLGVVRDQGEFFAVEQLRLHANALLQLIADNEPLTSLGPQNRRVFSYVKALLEAELSTCAANRGRLQEAVRLGLAAAKSLSPYLTEPPARGISMKILADILSDLSMGEVPPEQLLTIATPLLAACREAESSQNEGIRAYAYVYAGEAVRSLSRIEIYRGSPMLVSVRGLFTEIVARDPAGDASNAAQDARINSLYDAGQFEELLAFIEPLIEENRSQDNAIMLEAVRIVCQLHTGPLEEVTFAINDLVGRSPHGNYLLLSLSEALKKIGRELHRVIQAQPGLRERIQPVLDRVLARYYELVELAVLTTDVRYGVAW